MAMAMAKYPKTIFIGSVLLSKVAIEVLLKAGIKIDLICSLDETAAANVSDYYPLHEIAQREGIECLKFCKVIELTARIVEENPDFLFVIGISQIIPAQVLDSVKGCSIGFHPTALPKYRGRAPIPWMILLGEKDTKITLFKIDEGMDSGDILCQEPYIIREDDYASDVYNSVCKALDRAIVKNIPDLYKGTAKFWNQNEDEASFLLIRRPEDGAIDWRQDGKTIHTLIRAAAPPYPGAFTYYKEQKITILQAELKPNERYIGQPGQIAFMENEKIYVLTKDDQFLVITQYEPQMKFLVGGKFK